MTKIIAVIDTSVLRKHKSLETEEIQLLSELSRINAIDFYIPEMVEKEIISQELVEISDYFDKIISSINNLERRTILEEPVYKEDIIKYQENKNKEIQLIKKKWKDFIRDHGIHIIGFSSINVSKVFDDYVEGKPPYSNPKNRKDIPDSFILHSILSLYEKEIHFICCDKNLSIAAENQKAIKIYDSIEAFLELPELKNQIEEFEKLESVNEQFDIIKDKEDLIRNWTLSYIDNSIPIVLYTPKGSKSEGEDKLIEVLEIKYIDIQFNKARLYEDKQIVIPVLIKINCLIEYIKPKDVFLEESKVPLFEFYRNEIEIIEKENVILIKEPFTGTLTTALNINVKKPFKLSQDRVKFSDIRKKFLMSDIFSKVFNNMTKK